MSGAGLGGAWAVLGVVWGRGLVPGAEFPAAAAAADADSRPVRGTVNAPF